MNVSNDSNWVLITDNNVVAVDNSCNQENIGKFDYCKEEILSLIDKALQIDFLKINIMLFL